MNNRYELIKTKTVRDEDGFTTDYAMYLDHDTDTYIFMFGDTDITEPDAEYADWSCETLSCANEWFDSYEGFSDEDKIDDDVEIFDESVAELPKEAIHNKKPSRAKNSVLDKVNRALEMDENLCIGSKICENASGEANLRKINKALDKEAGSTEDIDDEPQILY